MIDKINDILSEVKERIEKAASESELQNVKGAFVGKQGSLSSLMKELPKLDPKDRPQMGKLLNQAKNQVTELIDSGVTVNVLNLGVLSNDSVSVLIRNILLSFAQFERDMIVERTQEGKALARQKKGFRDGRPKKYSDAQLNHAMELLEGHSYGQVIAMTGISKATLAREKKRRNNGYAVKET